MQYWQDYIAYRIREEVIQVIPRFEMLRVSVSNSTQRTLMEFSTIVFKFDVQIEIRSPLSQHDVRRYISGPFDSQAEQQAFVGFLQSTGCPEFVSVSAVQVELPSDLAAPTEKDADTMSAGLISGLAVALTAIAMLVTTFILVRMRNRRRVTEELGEDIGPLSLALSERNDYLSEIGVETVQNMSSLGDPVVSGLNLSMTDASTLEAKSIDYDFQLAYEEFASASVVSESHGDSSSFRSTLPATLSADDDTLGAHVYVSEELIEVLAPAGVLGLILETNVDGVPTVNSVKPSSVLAYQVQIGDRLLSVDGQDVTVMLASQVSKLIASKRNQHERNLVFMRSVRPSHSLDSVDNVR
jgi:hypothetical protein